MARNAAEYGHVELSSKLVGPDSVDSGHLQVDAAALLYIPAGIPEAVELSRDTILAEWFDGAPYLSEILCTPLGRIGLVTLPCFSDELYRRRVHLRRSALQAITMAARMGARTVTLMGLLASALNYGQSLSIEDPNIHVSTGHGTTAAALTMSMGTLMSSLRRDIALETLGVVGIGSVGRSTVKTILACLGHPASIILCDALNRPSLFHSLERELRESLRYRGTVLSAKAPHLAADVYKSTLLLGCTNVPNAIDVNKLARGTILLDDSVPRSFDVPAAVARMEHEGDVLVLTGGDIWVPWPVHHCLCRPDSLISPNPVVGL